MTAVDQDGAAANALPQRLHVCGFSLDATTKTCIVQMQFVHALRAAGLSGIRTSRRRFAALMPGFSDGSGDPHHLINAGAVA
jgi:hypothetical protein